MPDCIAWNVHRGKGRVTKFGKLDIVEAGDGNILGDADAALAQFAQGADGHDVVDADDSSGLFPGGQQGASGEASAIERIGVGRGSDLHAGIAGRGFEDGAGALVDWAEQRVVSDKAELSVAETVKVIDNFVAAGKGMTFCSPLRLPARTGVSARPVRSYFTEFETSRNSRSL